MAVSGRGGAPPHPMKMITPGVASALTPRELRPVRRPREEAAGAADAERRRSWLQLRVRLQHRGMPRLRPRHPQV